MVLRKREISNSSRTEATTQIIKILTDMEIVNQEHKGANIFPVYMLELFSPGLHHITYIRVEEAGIIIRRTYLYISG